MDIRQSKDRQILFNEQDPPHGKHARNGFGRRRVQLSVTYRHPSPFKGARLAVSMTGDVVEYWAHELEYFQTRWCRSSVKPPFARSQFVRIIGAIRHQRRRRKQILSSASILHHYAVRLRLESENVGAANPCRPGIFNQKLTWIVVYRRSNLIVSWIEVEGSTTLVRIQ